MLAVQRTFVNPRVPARPPRPHVALSSRRPDRNAPAVGSSVTWWCPNPCPPRASSRAPVGVADRVTVSCARGWNRWRSWGGGAGACGLGPRWPALGGELPGGPRLAAALGHSLKNQTRPGDGPSPGGGGLFKGPAKTGAEHGP